jgi:hypothetical protein
MNKLGKIAAAPLFLLALASDAAPLESGAWEILNTPGVASLDGQVLNELPIEPVKSTRICVTPKDAANPAAFFNRDMDPACSITKSSASGGSVHIAGTCPNQLEGPDGQFELKGKFDNRSYDIEFATTAFGDNGKMTFSGNLQGRYVGSCTDS